MCGICLPSPHSFHPNTYFMGEGDHMLSTWEVWFRIKTQPHWLWSHWSVWGPPLFFPSVLVPILLLFLEWQVTLFWAFRTATCINQNGHLSWVENKTQSIIEEMSLCSKRNTGMEFFPPPWNFMFQIILIRNFNDKFSCLRRKWFWVWSVISFQTQILWTH